MCPSCSYVPLGTYPEGMIGGMLQQALLWPWVAGIVAMVAIWQWFWIEGNSSDSVNDVVFICRATAVEKFLSVAEEGKA